MGVQLTQSGTEYNQVAYRGVNAATTQPLNLRQVVNGTNQTITAAVNPTITTKENNAEYKSFETLAAGVTKYRVYMWIEGQDIDCDNSATGSDISFKVELSTTNTNSSAAASSSSGA